MKKLIYLVLALPLLAAKCEKEQPKAVVINTPTPTDSTSTDSTKTELDKLPPITTTGANTFGCLLNGKAWLPTSGGTTNPKLAVDYFNGRCFIRGSIFGETQINNTKLRSSIQCNISNFFKKDIYYLKDGNAFLSHTQIQKECQYSFVDNLSGLIMISKLDTVQRIISGQFDFILYVDQTCDTVKITDGRFDVKY